MREKRKKYMSNRIITQDLLIMRLVLNVNGLLNNVRVLFENFRLMVEVGCLCAVDKVRAKSLAASGDSLDTFEIDWLNFKTLSSYPYLPSNSLKTIYFYHHKVGSHKSK